LVNKINSRKKSIILSVLAVVISVSILSAISLIDFQTSSTSSNISEYLPDNSISMDSYIETLSTTHTYKVETSTYFELYFTESDYARHLEGLRQLEGARLILYPPNASQLIDHLKPNPGTVVIFPTFTAAAYYPNGFYDYYYGSCDQSCVNDVRFENFHFDYNESGVTAQILYHVGYDFLTDVEVDKNPELLKNYDTVILLHNEYVTKKEFDAITSHPNLIFLHPNALYAEIDVNHETKTMTLIRGHDYPPDNPVANGFDYEIEKQFHKLEHNSSCIDWEFIKIPNGFHLNCYPDSVIREKLDILQKIKEL